MWKLLFPTLALALLLLPPAAAHAAPPEPPAVKTTDGTFIQIEQGDYAHWDMRTKDGKKVSYFVLHPDATVEEVMANPSARIGQKCRVQWKTTTEDIPEAGGKMPVDQILNVEWLK